MDSIVVCSHLYFPFSKLSYCGNSRVSTARQCEMRLRIPEIPSICIARNAIEHIQMRGDYNRQMRSWIAESAQLNSGDRRYSLEIITGELDSLES